MTSTVAAIALPLFVPADRPDRFARAFTFAADAAILDLEDAVPPGRKAEARDALVAARDAVAAAACPVLVRINAVGTHWHAADLAAVRTLRLAAIVLPKAESADGLAGVAEAAGCPAVALIESAQGLAAAREIAHAAARLAFGSIDFAADLGCAHTREALLAARSELVMASRLAGLPAPLDGVTAAYGVAGAGAVEDDARYAAALGFAGKLLIHPTQVVPARAGFAPSAEDRAWAERVLAASPEAGAVAVDGAMVDAPVRLRAKSIMRRAAPKDLR